MRIFPIGLLFVSAAFAQNTAGLATLSGHTYGPKSKPLSKVTLTLQLFGNPGQTGPEFKPYGVVSDAEGKYSFNGVDPGRYYLTATHNGYLRANYGVLRPGMPMKILVLSAGKEVKDADIELAPEAAISGRVLDEEGEPVPRVSVRVIHKAYLPSGEMRYVNDGGAVTDENGKYRMTGLQPGKYLLSVVPILPFTSRGLPAGQTVDIGPLPTFYPSAPDESTAETIVLAAAAQETDKNFRMRTGPVYHVKGTLPPDQRPKPGQLVRVSLSSRTAALRSSGMGYMVNPDGSFDIPGVAPGPYTLIVNSPNAAGPGRVVASLSVNAGTPQAEDLKVQPLSLLTLTGSVKSDAPVPNLRVILRPSGFVVANPPQPAAVSAEGSFSIADITPGEYHVGYSGIGQSRYVKSLKLAGKERLGIGIDLSDGVPGPLEITLASDSSRIAGIVKNKQGDPAAVCTVTLTPDDHSRTDLNRRAACTSDGHFVIPVVPPGKYRVHAFDYLDPTEEYDPTFRKLRDQDGQAVTVAPSAPQELTLSLQ